MFRIVNASGGAVYRSRNEPIMHLHSRILAAIPAVVLALHAHPQAMGNLMYETNSRIFFQQAEQPVKASIQGNMLVLEVNAMMNMKADSLMNARIDGFTQRVKEHGVKEKDVFPDMLSFVPVYEIETTRKLFSKTYQEVPAGFEIQKNIHVRFTDASILDRLVTAAAKEEIYDLVKVDFFVVDQSACYDTLRMFATKLLHQKLDNFAKLGLKVEESHRTGAERNGAYFPLDRYTQYRSRTQSSLNSRRRGQIVNDVKQSNTLFYNKVPYGQFDIVLHAEITEPPVQYTYNLTLQCQLPEAFPKKDVKEIIKYLWITKEGEVRELNVGS